MAADLIENYYIEKPDNTWSPHPMFQFFREYNPDCDWSRALEGEPGQYVVITRRAGSNYYIGAITNEQPRHIRLPLSFLDKGIYTAILYADAPDAHYQNNPTAYRIDNLSVTRQDHLDLHLSPGGGCAVTLLPSK